jgi:DUF1680 family protein
VRLTVRDPKRKAFALQLRVPQWTKSFTATVGKEKWNGKPGTFLTIDRDWKAGDTVNIDMDMTVRVLPGGKSYPDSVAVERGPQILAAEDSLNSGNITVSRALSTVSPIASPSGWSGSQVYKAESAILVPFADAVSMRVWLPAR